MASVILLRKLPCIFPPFLFGGQAEVEEDGEGERGGSPDWWGEAYLSISYNYQGKQPLRDYEFLMMHYLGQLNFLEIRLFQEMLNC